MRIKELDQKKLTIVLAAYIDNMTMWAKMSERVKNMPGAIKENMEIMKGYGQELLDKYGHKKYLDDYRKFNNWKKDIV